MEETKLKNIYQSIPAVMGKIKAVEKDHINQMQKYRFRSIDDVYNACNKAMADEKITIEPKYSIICNDLTKNDRGGLVRSVVIQGSYKIIAEDGSFIEISTIGEAIDHSDKAFNKAMSQAFKYALFQVFMIPTEEEKDTEAKDNPIPPKTQNAPKKEEPKQDKTLENELNEETKINILKTKASEIMGKRGIKKQDQKKKVQEIRDLLKFNKAVIDFSLRDWETVVRFLEDEK